MNELKEYEEKGGYVFHGSSNGTIHEFEPRQAMNFNKPDGTPAIFASDRVEPAIFMAVLGSRKVGGMGKKDLPGFGFYIQESDWQRSLAEDWTGYVYVLLKDTFTHDGMWQWRSATAVKPTKRYMVTLKDLPSDIEIMTDEAFTAYLDANR